MTVSNFIEYIKKYFKSVSHGVVDKLNGQKGPLTYRHRTMLKKEFSVSGKWDSIQINGAMVKADYVAMDSKLPLKRRDSISKASGDIPKIGMKMWLNENQLSDLQTMVATGSTETAIAAKLFQDTAKVIGGVLEANEASFLIGLSTGITLVDDDKNVGTGIRLDYNFLAENKFGTSKVFSDPTSTPLTDINMKILEKASIDGNAVTTIMLDRATMTNILKSDEAKDLFASSVGNFSSTIRPTPNIAQLNNAVQSEYGYVFDVVDRSVVYEKNGVRTSFKPWAAGAIAAISNPIVGTLTYAKLAEMGAPVEGVSYQTVEDYILVSKFRDNEPLSEYTTSQARVIPVISETVYLLDSLTVQA